jgi:hypothetical protein
MSSPAAVASITRHSSLFFLTGLVSATWAARLPAVQEGLGLSAEPGLGLMRFDRR